MLWNLRKVLEIPVFFHIYAIDFSKGSLYNPIFDSISP